MHHLPLALAVGVALGGCVHTPPGTSVEVALAKKPEVVRMPAPATPAPARLGSAPGAGGNSGNKADGESEKTARVAEAYSRGEFCMNAGKDPEAIEAFREVVKLDPTFTEAWNRLAALFEKAGNDKEALNAFKQAKLAGNNPAAHAKPE